MDDSAIIDLYWNRSEEAISETAVKYGGYCYSIAHNVLGSREDAQESVNDTYLATWNSLPPHRPRSFSAFLGKLTRRISIDRWRRLTAAKRGGGQVSLALEELGDCASQGPDVEEIAISRELAEAYARFLEGLEMTERMVFLRRYFYMDSVADIAGSFGFTLGKVNSMLYRTREKLRVRLEKEGYL